MGELYFERFSGLNLAAALRNDPAALISGKNFLIDDDNGVRKSFGSGLAYDGHSLKGIKSIFFHNQIASLLFLHGLDKTTDTPKLKVFDGAWREIGSGLFDDINSIWAVSYKTDPYMFWGNHAGYFDISMEGKSFPDTANTATSTVALKLVDASASFWTLGVTKWMRVHNVTDDTYATILAVEDDNTLLLDTDIMVSGEEYRIVHDGFVDLDQINRAWYLQNGGTESVYQPIQGLSPLIHFNALWIVGTGDYRNTLIRTKAFSNIFYDLYTGNLPAINYVSVGGDDSVSGATDDYLTGAAEWDADVFVTKRFSCHRVVGQISNYRSVLVNPKVGCRYPETMKATKSGIIFLSNFRDGFYLFNGGLANISRPFIDKYLLRLKEGDLVCAGYVFNRYYVASLGDITLVFDTDQNAWTVIEETYAGFAEDGTNSICVKNTYTTTVSQVEDPERPGEDQDVLLLTPTESNLYAFDMGGSFEKDADGLNGSDLDFEIKTPHLDCGSKGRKKVFDRLTLLVDSGEPLVTVDVDIDGHIYDDIRTAIDINPLWEASDYYKDDFSVKPAQAISFDLMGMQSGYTISFKIKSSSQAEFKIFGGVLYYRWTGKKTEENEP